MYKLIIEDDEGKTTVVPLIRDEISIGRKEGNTIRLTERNVSRRHAKLVKQNGAIFIEDLKSYNGIKVNGNKIAGRVAVAEGDRIQIGDYVLGLKREGPQAQKPEQQLEEGPEAPTKQLDVSGLTEEPERREPPSEPARLVCVSKNFAGLEFTLSRSTIVIGRTEENDIVINHRSISRHHARVVEEHGRYKISDMQSANGVRVNGEEYNKVELRKGDHIDLGHVRLRFVAPGEDFVFARDADVVDPNKLGGSSKSGAWLVLALIAVAAVGVLLWKVMSGQGKQPTDDGSSVTKRTKDNKTASPVKKDAPPFKSDADQKELLAQLDTALGRQDWPSALRHCDRLAGSVRQARKTDCQRATDEQKAKKLMEDAVAAATKNEHKTALEYYHKVPATSIYAAQRDKSPTYRETRKKYRAAIAMEIDELLAKRECAGAKKLTELATMLPDAPATERKTLVAKVLGCKRAVTPRDAGQPDKVATNVPPRRPRRPTHLPRHPRTTAPVQPKPPAITAEQRAAAAALKPQVWDAWRSGNHGRTLALGVKYLTVFKRDQEMLAIVGASACKMKNGREAKSAYRRLGSARQAMLRALCMKSGVRLP